MSKVIVNSQTWLQNFRPYVNGERVRWPDLQLNMAAGQSVELTLEFEYSYMIGDPDSGLRLCCEPMAGEVGLVCNPPFEQLVEMAEGLISLTWTLTANADSTGLFGLHFEMPLYDGMPSSPPVPGEVLNYALELEIKFDESQMRLGSHAYPCHGAEHTFTVLPKLGSQLLNKNIALVTEGGQLGVEFTPSLTTPQLLGPGGVSWKLDCRKTTTNGGFSLALNAENVTSAPLFMSLDHNLVSVERWRTDHSQWPEWTPYTVSHIRAKSVYLGSVAPGVRVIINNGVRFDITNSQGEFSEREASLTILNRYNNIIV
ncbi:hypothetical protein [Pseudomonas granadensis]|uniref:hypothetical protein n=1 Tax=Pseudomonas granadensis TaxID=1421430 RepID=UPI00087B429A|nr:hypothetical protein [Pseudomonas granadensis]SDT45621.1 hypothetical protein SAMN05216579_3874 [Pseudomonas granadensis]